MAGKVKIRGKLKGDIAEVKSLIPHPMETGTRRTEGGNDRDRGLRLSRYGQGYSATATVTMAGSGMFQTGPWPCFFNTSSTTAARIAAAF